MSQSTESPFKDNTNNLSLEKYKQIISNFQTIYHLLDLADLDELWIRNMSIKRDLGCWFTVLRKTYWDEDLCSEATIRWVTVSMGGSAWGWGRLQGRGSLRLLTPATWMSMQGVEAVCSPSSSSFLAWFSFWICIWGLRGGVGDGLGDSPAGASKLGISFGLLNYPFAQHTQEHVIMK